MSNRKLLVADDSVTIQKVINLTFADEGIDVMTVGDGDTAMERLYDFRPDIVLADVNMPGMNGYRICENLRGRSDTKNIPVILLVGSFESFDEDEARRVGANDWITKPFQSIRQLVSKVTELVEAPVSNGVQETEAFTESEIPAAVEAKVSPPADYEDIDNLYKQSFVETVELPGAFRAEQVLGDAGMDDEMIETVHAGSSAADHGAREFGFTPVADIPNFSETLPETERPTFEMPADENPGFFEETLPVIDFRPADDPDRIPVSFDDFHEPTPILQEESPAKEDEGFDLKSEPEIEVLHPAASEGAPPVFDEMNLLELPAEQPASPESMRPDDELLALAKTGGPDDLSPEFIDAVARKVIEKISENVIRQIAWQVVPQVVESVLREKADEEPSH